MRYSIVKRCEWNEKVDEIYQAIHNVDASNNLGDISKINGSDIPDIDIFFHSSPCQNFSNINMAQKTGGEEGTENQSSLMWESLRLLKEHPETKICIWENVAAACRGVNKPNFDKYINTLYELGYTSYYKVLNPKDFGIPQNRARLFCVSINRKYLNPDKFEMPVETYEKCDMFSYLDKSVDSKYIVPERVMKGMDNKTSIFRERFLIKKPGDIAYCLVAKGGRSTITCNYVFNDFNLYKNLPCEPNAKGLHFLAEHSDEYPIRALTPNEFWRLQSIPQKYFDRAIKSKISDNRLYCAAGNGINAYVMMLVYEQLYLAYPEVFNDMKQFTAFSGFGCQEVALDMLYENVIENRKVS